MEEFSWFALAAVVLHWAVVIGLSARVIMRRRPVGVLLAWLALILSVPVIGVLIYLFVGENRVSEKYLKRGIATQGLYAQWKQSLRIREAVDWSIISPLAIPLQRQAQSVTGFPALQGNQVELLQDFASVFRSLIEDVNQCHSTCHLEFYIWSAGGLADELLKPSSRRQSAVESAVSCSMRWAANPFFAAMARRA